MAKSKGDYLRRYQTQIEHARKWREKEGYDKLWRRMVDMYRGKQVVNLTPEDRIVVNIAFATVNVIAPSVSINYPKITVNPTKPENDDQAVIGEALINYEWRHHDYQDEFREAVNDYLQIGHGWVKTGYAYQETLEEADPRDFQQEYEEKIDEVRNFAAENPEQAEFLPTDDEVREHLTGTQIVVAKDQPFVERISPWDMYVSPMATNLKNARWIAQRIVVPIEEIRNNEQYNRTARMAVKGDLESFVERDGHWSTKDREVGEVEWATIWEFYDLPRRQMCVFAHDAKSYLVDPKPIPLVFGHPYTMIRNYDIPEFFYPMGDLEAIESLQLELNKTRSQFMQARKKNARKFLARKGAFGAEGRAALESDQDNQIVEVITDAPFSELIAPLEQTQLPTELYRHSEQVEDDIALVTGVSEYQHGQVPETRRTATEAAIISDSVTARASDKLATIEKALARVARKVFQTLQQFAEGEQVFKVTGIDGMNIWVPWDHDTIKGEYDFEVEAGSTQPMNDTVRRQTAVAVMQAVGPFVGTVIDPYALARYVLQFGFGIKNPEKFFMAPQPEMMGEEGEEGPEEPGGVGGMQEPPMGGGYIDQETGDTSSEARVPEGIRNQLLGQVGLGLGGGMG